MARKPNYRFERTQRTRDKEAKKAAKAAEKAAKRAAKRQDGEDPDLVGIVAGVQPPAEPAEE